MSVPLADRVRTELLLSHVGRARGITGRALAQAVRAPEREVRHAITELREAGEPICAHPGTGYFLAQTAEELDMACAFLRSRALHSLALESKLRKVPLPDLVGQLQMNLDTEVPDGR